MQNALRTSGWRGWLLLVLLAGCGAGTARAQEYDVQVWVVRASKSGDKVSPEIRALAEQLKKKYGYTSAILEKTLSGKATEAKPYQSDVAGPYKVRVRPKDRKGDRVTLQVTVTRTVEKKADKDDKDDKDKKRGDRGRRDRGEKDKGQDGKGKDDRGRRADRDGGDDEELVANVTMTLDQGKAAPIEGLRYPGGAADDVLVLAISAK
jgi:hypothetical protein